MDKTTLLNTIQTEYAHLEALLAPLHERQLCTPPSKGEWPIADNSFEYYDDHAQQIQHLLDTSKKDTHDHSE